MDFRLFCVALSLLCASECWTHENCASLNRICKSLAEMTSSCSVFLYSRTHGGCSHPRPKKQGDSNRRKGDTELSPDLQPQQYVLVSAGPGSWTEADPLLIWCWQRWERRCPWWVHGYQTKPRELLPHSGDGFPLSDSCVLLCQQWCTAMCGCLLSAHKVN